MFNLLTGITINRKPEPSSAARWIEEKLETLHSFNPVLWIPTFPPPQKEKYGENITKLINFNHSKTKVKEMFSFFVTILDEAITYYVWKVLFFLICLFALHCILVEGEIVIKLTIPLVIYSATHCNYKETPKILSILTLCSNFFQL